MYGQVKRHVNIEYTPQHERMKKFLGSFLHCKMICEKYLTGNGKRKDASDMEALSERMYDECRRRCEAVEQFIESLKICDEEKKLLRLHYFEGKSIESIAEYLYVSRSTAFRISKRAEANALAAFISYEGGESA